MCLRHLAAVQQDLTLSLAQIDAGGEEVDPAATPSLLAAAILQEDTSFAGDAAATADAVRRLLAQLVVALEEACLHHRSSRSDSPEALHARLRAAEDLGNLLRQSDTVLRADLATMSEDLDVAVGELGLRRNQVVALTLRLSSAAAPCGASRIGDAAPASSVAGAGAGASAEPSRAPLSAATEGVRRSKEQSGGAAASADAAAGGESAGAANGLVPSVVLATRLAAAEAENRELRQVTDGRAAELHQALEDRRKLEADAITAAATSRGPPSTSLVRGSALYQTMEATLQQLAVSQRSWNRERAAIVEDTASEAAATSRELTRVREWSSSLLDDLSRQLAEALKTAEAAALARDRLHTTYEAKKLDVAAGKPAPDSEAVLRQTLERHVRVALDFSYGVHTNVLSACSSSACSPSFGALSLVNAFPSTPADPLAALCFVFISGMGMFILGDAEDSGDRSRSAQGQARGLSEALSIGRRQTCFQRVGYQ